jgi:predicted transglutaminase-like cysteine proteinase
MKRPVQMFTIARSPSLSEKLRRGRFWASLTAASLALVFANAAYARPLGLPTDTAPPMASRVANGINAAALPIGDGGDVTTAPPKPPTPKQLFGMRTEPVAVGELPEKWRHIAAAIFGDFAVVAQCHANGPCPVAAQRLIDISAQGAGRNGWKRVGLINRAANLAISPVSDEIQWGVVDHWSDPFETLLSRRGDCEDYAILKYAALLEAGIPRSDVKIIILRNLFPPEDHAAVATRIGDLWVILDNRTLALVRDLDVTRAIPEFVLDQDGVRRFD